MALKATRGAQPISAELPGQVAEAEGFEPSMGCKSQTALAVCWGSSEHDPLYPTATRPCSSAWGVVRCGLTASEHVPRSWCHPRAITVPPDHTYSRALNLGLHRRPAPIRSRTPGVGHGTASVSLHPAPPRPRSRAPHQCGRRSSAPIRGCTACARRYAPEGRPRSAHRRSVRPGRAWCARALPWRGRACGATRCAPECPASQSCPG